MEGILLDVLLLAVVVLFAILGARKGMVLTLCSLVAVLVAVVGASLVSGALTPVLAKQAAPMLEGFITDNLEALVGSAQAAQAAQEAPSGFLWEVLKGLTDQVDLPDLTAASAQVVSTLALLAAQAVLRPILFLIAFVLILIIWFFLSHALDLVAKLPVLHTLNTAGGVVFGAVKGAILLTIAALLIQLFFPDLIPPAAVEGSRILAALQKAPALF